MDIKIPRLYIQQPSHFTSFPDLTLLWSITQAQEQAVLSKHHILHSQPQHLLQVWANKSQMVGGKDHLLPHVLTAVPTVGI